MPEASKLTARNQYFHAMALTMHNSQNKPRAEPWPRQGISMWHNIGQRPPSSPAEHPKLHNPPQLCAVAVLAHGHSPGCGSMWHHVKSPSDLTSRNPMTVTFCPSTVQWPFKGVGSSMLSML